jgi:hypothetical protein
MRNITLFNLNSIVPFIMSSCLCCILAWLLTLTFPQPQGIDLTTLVWYLIGLSGAIMVFWIIDMILEFIVFIALKIKTKQWVWDAEPLKVNSIGCCMLTIAWMIFYIYSWFISIWYVAQCQFDLEELIKLMPLYDILINIPVIVIILVMIQIILIAINDFRKE